MYTSHFSTSKTIDINHPSPAKLASKQAHKQLDNARLKSLFTLKEQELKHIDDLEARYVKGVHFAAKQNRVKNTEKLLSGIIAWHEEFKDQSLPQEVVKVVCSRFNRHQEIIDDLRILVHYAKGRKLRKELLKQVARHSEEGLSNARLRRIRLKALAVLEFELSHLPSHHPYTSTYEFILKAKFHRKVIPSQNADFDRGSGTAIRNLIDSIVHMANNGCSSEEFQAAMTEHFLYFGEYFGKHEKDLAFYDDFRQVLPSNALARCSAKEFERIRWVYHVRPQLLQNLNFNASEGWNGKVVFDAMFEHFNVPYVLRERFFSRRADAKEHRMFELVLTGKNLVTFEHLPFRVTKKVAHAFLNYHPDYIPSTWEALAFLHIKRETDDAAYAHAVLPVLEAPGPNDYWLKTMCSLHRFGLPTNRAREVIDYIAHEQFAENRPVHLKGKSINTLLNEVDEWHEYVAFQEYSSGPKVNFPVLELEEVDFETLELPFRVKQILDSYELWKEGRAQKHCVNTYLNRCKSGITSIFSLQKKREKKGWTRSLTIEVRDSAVIQARGITNRAPSAEEMNALQIWTEGAGLQLNLDFDLFDEFF